MPEECKRITMITRKGGRKEIEPTPKAKATKKSQAETVKEGESDAGNT